MTQKLQFPVRIPFVELLGFELLRMDGGEAEIAFKPSGEHLNSFDVVHGGASMTLMDVVMAHAARTRELLALRTELRRLATAAAQTAANAEAKGGSQNAGAV